jgi:hypothetical protein
MDRIEIHSLYGCGVDFVRFVMVKEEWSLKVPIPGNQLVNGHIGRRFGGTPAIQTIIPRCQRTRTKAPENLGILGIAYSDSWLVDTLMPLQRSMIRPVNAIATRNLVRVKTTRTAFHGGKRALADFHVTPPLGKSILYIIAVCRRYRKAGKDAAPSVTRNVWRLRQGGGNRTNVSVCDD